MDWDAMLVDLENRFDAERRAGIAAEAADLAEAEISSVRLIDRLRGAIGRTVRVRTRGGTALAGTLTRTEEDFLLIEEGEGVRALVPISALAVVAPLPGPAPESAGRYRPTLRSLARELARGGARVRAATAVGEVIGRIGRVGADYLDIIVDSPHDGGAPPGGAGRTGIATVPLAALDALRSR